VKYYSVPADFKIKSIHDIARLNELNYGAKVVEVYGQITSGKIITSGRSSQLLPEVDLKALEEYVKQCKSNSIVFNYTLNSSCIGNQEFSDEGIMEITNLLEALSNIGVESLTIAMPSLFELVKASRFKFKTKASAICEISSVNKATFYKKLGAERIVVDPDITRDFKKLKRITGAVGSGVEIIINNVCFRDCAYKMFHYNHESHCNQTNKGQTIKDYYFHRCSMQKADQLRNVIKLNWIRPEDIKYYAEAGITHFKIQGRQSVLKGDLIKTLEYYFKEDYSGNLYSLITLFDSYNSFQPYIDNKSLEGFIKTFYEKPDFCQENCSRCGYCDMYTEKSMNLAETKEINSMATEFYNNFDEYIKRINMENTYTPFQKLFSEDDLNIDLNDMFAEGG
jgi:collagenase-like PrtC family protease